MTERPRVAPTGAPADASAGTGTSTGTDRILFVGTATTLIQAAGFTILTDPNFLHRGQRAYVGMGLTTRRLTEPALSAGELPPLDFVVLSHHHGDHFDRIAARDLDHGLPIVTEPHAARKLRRQGFRSPVALSTWQSHVVARDDAEVRGDVPARPARAPAARLRRAAGDGQPARL